MRLAIVGSTALGQNKEAKEIILEAFKRLSPILVVSGGAVGIDTLGVTLAKEQGIATKEYLPVDNTWASGYKPRNLLIAQNCDYLIRIAWKRSKTYGSGWTRDRAMELGVPCEEFVLDA